MIRALSLASTSVFILISISLCAVAADLNGYTARYEVSLNIPTPTGKTSCSGKSNKNPNASNEYIIRDNNGWKEINNSRYRYYFVCPGDYSAFGKITLTASGSAGKERYIVWWSDTRYDVSTHPYHMVNEPANSLYKSQARVREFSINGADFLIVDRLEVTGASNGIFFERESGSTDNVFNRLYIHHTGRTDGGAGSWAVFVNRGRRGVNNNARNTVQNSVVGPCAVQPGSYDNNGILFYKAADDGRAVNNEVFNCTDPLNIAGQFNSDNNVRGIVFENNDLYMTDAIYSDGSGRLTKNGTYMCAENGIDVKDGPRLSNPNYATSIIHNRIWGLRKGDSKCGGNNPSGAAIDIQMGGSYTLVQGNIIQNVAMGINSPNEKTSNVSILGNIIYDVDTRDDLGRSRGLNLIRAWNWELYNNTFARVSGQDSAWIYMNSAQHDISCNLVIDSSNAPAKGSNAGYTARNVFVNTNKIGTSYKTYGSALSANLEDYTYFRKLLTSPEKVTLPNIKPTPSSAFVNHCSSFKPSAGFGLNTQSGL